MHCSSTSVRRAGAQPQRPDIFGGVAVEIASPGPLTAQTLLTPLPASFRLAEDVARPHHGVLNVGAGLALEAQRIFEVEGDHRVARELEHEVAQRADRNLLGNLLPFRSSRPVWRASTSARVAAMSLSIRSSALTPKPLRPLTSM
jgi:hypothetical protein